MINIFELSALDQNDIRESENYASEVIAIHYTHHLGRSFVALPESV